MDPIATTEGAGSLLSNPAMTIVSIGAIAAHIAAARWLKVGRSIDTSSHVVRGPDKWILKDAAIWTAIALYIAAAGFLLGRFTGEF